MTGKHRNGEHNTLERPQVSEKEDKVVGDGASYVDQGEKIVFQTEVGMDRETSQAAARRFVRLPIDRQQRGATGGSTDSEGARIGRETTLFKETSGGTRKQQQRKSPLAIL